MIKGQSVSQDDKSPIDFLRWVRTVDFYFVHKRQKWFNAEGELLTEEELYERYLESLNS